MEKGHMHCIRYITGHNGNIHSRHGYYYQCCLIGEKMQPNPIFSMEEMSK